MPVNLTHLAQLLSTLDVEARRVSSIHRALHEQLSQAAREHSADRALLVELKAGLRKWREAHDAQLDRVHEQEVLIQQLEAQKDECAKKLASEVAARAEDKAAHQALWQEAEQLIQQVDLVMKQDTELWERSPAEGMPEFVPANSRKMPIISVVNLKGGVGKTTVTANLGGALTLQGYRALMIDLDYQSSLTSLCLKEEVYQRVLRAGPQRSIEAVLRDGAMTGEGLLKLVEPLRGRDLGLVPSHEHLSQAEIKTLVRWMTRPKDGDVRYLLRRALHAREVCDRYDFVLIDCPPRLTTACVNALAASDYVLVPALLDGLTLEAIPRLLKSIRRLASKISPKLEVMGIVANRATPHNGQPIQRERQQWTQLEQKVVDAWGGEVPRLRSVIFKHADFATAANEHRIASLTSGEAQSRFLDLTNEVIGRIPLNERRQLAIVR